MSIIGSINSRAQLIRKKINPKKNEELKETDADQSKEQTEEENAGGESATNFEKTLTDPLKDICVDMKDELELLDGEKMEEDEPKYTSNLDQTIMIGEMDDGSESMFDELKMQTQRTD